MNDGLYKSSHDKCPSILSAHKMKKKKKKEKEIREFCFLEKVKFYLYENSIIKTKK